jgi:hypothetical protein
MILLAGLAVGIYHFAGVTGFFASGSDFLSNDERGWIKSPVMKVILPICQEGGLAFVWLACKNGRLHS